MVIKASLNIFVSLEWQSDAHKNIALLPQTLAAIARSFVEEYMFRIKIVALTIFVGGLIFSISPRSISQDQTGNVCKCSPEIVDSCFTVHGRLSLCNGTPTFRIWVVGTKHMLGVHESERKPPIAGQDSFYAMPAGLLKWLSDTSTVFADFRVGPLQKYHKGEMQLVCVQSATNIVVKQYSFYEGKKVKVFRLKDLWTQMCPEC